MAENETASTNEESNSDSAGIDNLKVLENIDINQQVIFYIKLASFLLLLFKYKGKLKCHKQFQISQLH